MGMGDIICPVAVPTLLSLKEESSERGTCESLPCTRATQGTYPVRPPSTREVPLPRPPPRREAWGTQQSYVSGITVEWIWVTGHQDRPPESKIPPQARRHKDE